MPLERWDWLGEGLRLPPTLGLVVGFEALWVEVLVVPGWVGLVCGIGGLLGLVLNGLLSTIHEGTLECVVPIDLIECAQLVCAQRGVASRSIWSWGVLGGSLRCSIVGRIWLLTASLLSLVVCWG